MASATGGDQQRLTPQQVAVAAAMTELTACEHRDREITEELKGDLDATKRYLLSQEQGRLKENIWAYKRVIESKGEMSFAKAAERERTGCVG